MSKQASLMDDHNQGSRVPVDEVNKELEEQQDTFDEVEVEKLYEDGGIEGMGGDDEDQPVDLPLGEHVHKQDDEEDDTPRPENN